MSKVPGGSFVSSDIEKTTTVMMIAMINVANPTIPYHNQTTETGFGWSSWLKTTMT